MDELFQCGCDGLSAALRFLQSIGFAEIRQTLELVGVHHVEVAGGLLLFVLLQFTKFTAVLLLACLIGYAIFYMWDTWFPEVRQSLAVNSPMTYHSGFSPGYGPLYESLNTNNRDARTSALFPPFGNNESLNALQGSVTSEQEATPAAPSRRSPSRSGNATPIGYQASSANFRPHRRQFPNQFDEYKRHPMERDNQLFRRMIANEYRLYRPGTATEHQRYSIQREDPRSRRLPAPSEEARQQKNRRFADNRSAPQGRQNANDSRRTRHIPGTADRSGGADTSHNNTDYRGAKRRSGK
ncbi:GH19181 [Drosophila grimshawi]|uniref:GH19181 n=1 Tax=Drosophila grimshawi TaxID=7222 RepID=B4JEU0_DROGR|nr:GH19181 [Drosophila grimshawi]